MRLSEVKRILSLVIKPGKKQLKTPFIQSAPGIGKSSVIKQFAKENELEVIDFRLSQHDATDFKMPHVLREEKSYTFLTPDFLPFEGSPIYDKDFNGGIETKGVLVFDEINQARQDVLQAIFQIVHDFQIGHKKLLPNWYIVAAGNLGIEDGTDVVEFSTALKDRFLTLKVGLHEIYEDWINYAEANQLHPMVINFIKSKPSSLYWGLGEKEKEKNLDNDLVTPRRWEDFSNVLKENSDIPLLELVDMIGRPYIHGLFLNFRDYCIEQDQITAKDVLYKFEEKKQQIETLKRDRIVALFSEIIQETHSADLTPQVFTNFRNFCKGVLSEDLYFMLISKISRAGKDDPKKRIFVDSYFKVFPEEDKYLRNILMAAIDVKS